MTAETVLICTFLEQEHVDRIRAAWPGEVLYRPDLVPVPRYVADHGGARRELTTEQADEWRELLHRAQIAFDFDWSDPGHLLENCPQLQWVQATSAGIGGFVERYGLDRDGAPVFTTAAGTHAAPLAEFALTGALYFVKDVPGLLDHQRRHHWERYTVASLAGRRVTVVGLGAIGRHTASVFAGLGAAVTGVGRPGGSRPDLAGVTTTDTDALDEVLARTDVLVLACPLTPATRGLIDAGRLAALPPGAVLVNIARGSVVDHPALSDALRTGHLRGAALDVTDPEPLPADSPLWDLPSVLVSPHSASTIDTENAVLTDLFLDNLERFAQGRALRNRYHPDLGY